MEYRNHIDTITGLGLEISFPKIGVKEEADFYRRGDLLLRRTDTGEIVATISADHFFDEAGNRFIFS